MSSEYLELGRADSSACVPTSSTRPCDVDMQHIQRFAAGFTAVSVVKLLEMESCRIPEQWNACELCLPVGNTKVACNMIKSIASLCSDGVPACITCAMTTIWSADCTVDRRWAMTNTVRPRTSRATAWRTCCAISLQSVVCSSPALISDSFRMAAFPKGRLATSFLQHLCSLRKFCPSFVQRDERDYSIE
jgi:hypothetical protein